MKITLFTSNQPRHLSLANQLSGICDELYCIQECNTVFPGKVEDLFKKSPVMQEYFQHVMRSEKRWFGDVSFHAKNTRSLALKSGDLNSVSEQVLSEALKSDVFVVFGASYIKGWLIESLVERGAINIHMGLSPYYRGSSCNFWALYDGNPTYVGATVHKLSKGLDSGPMLYHCVPKYEGENPFEFTMKSVVAAHNSLTARISSGDIFRLQPVAQDKTKQVRYTRNADFCDGVAEEFLRREIDLRSLMSDTDSASYPDLLDPYIG